VRIGRARWVVRRQCRCRCHDLGLRSRALALARSSGGAQTCGLMVFVGCRGIAVVRSESSWVCMVGGDYLRARCWTRGRGAEHSCSCGRLERMVVTKPCRFAVRNVSVNCPLIGSLCPPLDPCSPPTWPLTAPKRPPYRLHYRKAMVSGRYGIRRSWEFAVGTPCLPVVCTGAQLVAEKKSLAGCCT
jgi:hypothetical protein